MQWPRAVRAVRRAADIARIADPGPASRSRCLTYQALCQLDDPEIALGRLAQPRWAADRATATGVELEEVAREGERVRRRGGRPARDASSRAITRLAQARDRPRRARRASSWRELLSATAARARRRAARRPASATIVLDECHHLASLWGYVVRAVLDELRDERARDRPDRHAARSSSPSDEAELYAELLGPVDFTVPTPAVVREGHLAPYQELAWLTEPLDSERAWLAEHDTRFNELITALHDDAESGRARSRPG